MKIYLCIVGILSASVLVQSEVAKSLAEWENHVHGCLNEFGLTKDAFNTPDFGDAKLKCFSACIMKNGDRMTEGKLSVDKEMEMAAIYMPDKVDNSLREKFTDCVNIANQEKDDCGVAGSMYRCLYEKYGLWKAEDLEQISKQN